VLVVEQGLKIHISLSLTSHVFSGFLHFYRPPSWQEETLIYSIDHFNIRFYSGDVVGAAALGWPEIPHGFQKFQIVLLAPHQDGTNPRYNHTTWSLVDTWATSPWVWPVRLASPRGCSQPVSKTCLTNLYWAFW